MRLVAFEQFFHLGDVGSIRRASSRVSRFTAMCLVIIAPPLLNDGLAAPGAREAPNDEARVLETGPAGRS